jgi:hypothetical protein
LPGKKKKKKLIGLAKNFLNPRESSDSSDSNDSKASTDNSELFSSEKDGDYKVANYAPRIEVQALYMYWLLPPDSRPFWPTLHQLWRPRRRRRRRRPAPVVCEL